MAKSKKTHLPVTNADVANNIIDNLMTNEQFCYNFFFPVDNDDTTYNIAPIRNYVIECMKRSYNYTFSASDFGLIMYEKLWDLGTWHVLSTFSGKYSFWTWLYTVTFHTITNYLEEQGIIKVQREPTGANTRLMLNQYSPSERLCIIEEVLPHGKNYDMLVDIYVNEKTDEEMVVSLNMDSTIYKKARKSAENYFRSRLIETCTGYENYVLSMKAPRVITVSSEELSNMADTYTVSSECNPFSDVLGVNLTDTEVKEKADEFVLDFITKRLKWNKRDCFLFMQRREGKSAKSVAAQLECRSDWVDTRFSRLNRVFKHEFKMWWGKNA